MNKIANDILKLARVLIAKVREGDFYKGSYADGAPFVITMWVSKVTSSEYHFSDYYGRKAVIPKDDFHQFLRDGLLTKLKGKKPSNDELEAWVKVNHGLVVRQLIPKYEIQINKFVSSLENKVLGDGGVVNSEIFINGDKVIRVKHRWNEQHYRLKLDGMASAFNTQSKELIRSGGLDKKLNKFFGRRVYKGGGVVSFDGTKISCDVNWKVRFDFNGAFELYGTVVNDQEIIESVPSLNVADEYKEYVKSVRDSFEQYVDDELLDDDDWHPDSIEVDYNQTGPSGDGWNEPRDDGELEVTDIDDTFSAEVNTERLINFALNDDDAADVIEVGAAGEIVRAALSGFGTKELGDFPEYTFEGDDFSTVLNARTTYSVLGADDDSVSLWMKVDPDYRELEEAIAER